MHDEIVVAIIGLVAAIMGLVGAIAGSLITAIFTARWDKKKINEERKKAFQINEGPWRKDLLKVLKNDKWDMSDVQLIKARMSLFVSIDKPGNEIVKIIEEQGDSNNDQFMNVIMADQLKRLEDELQTCEILPLKSTENVRQLLRIQLKKNFDHNNGAVGQEGRLRYSDLNSVMAVLKLSQTDEDNYREWLNVAKKEVPRELDR